ncbi:hypothetical protein [Sphingomonas parapaucimobilis]|uniref:Uncharacterized protein n=1 Tax=Sphingomonas parapaucimobilis NBRC 15100 TaxID=1219049 RepID=A0A0A1WAV2_9SPHN|nr:hypothetical protein [Sphingomonas parapaucimobilis]GAM02600.1 hypothetical protein SP5_095_00020 [Sphingomonas parapaucimobilis NBRC 15100]
MNDGMMIPQYDQPICTAGQVSTILARPRPTIAGWISRYSWLGIVAVQPGKTRLFTPSEIGTLVALRLAISAGNMADILGDSVDLITPEIDAEYDRLTGMMQLDEWGASGTLKPRLPKFDEANLILVSHGGGSKQGGLMPNAFMPTRSPKSEGAYIADMSGFELPEIVLPLGQGLRNAWTRMLWLLNGFAVVD